MFICQIRCFRIIRRIHNFHLNLENNLINIWYVLHCKIFQRTPCALFNHFYFSFKQKVSHLLFWYTLQEWHFAVTKCLRRSFCINIDSIAVRRLFHVRPEQLSRAETVIWGWLRDTHMTSCLMDGILSAAAFPVVTRDWWLLPWSQLFPSFSRSATEQPQHLWGQKKIDASGRAPPWATHYLVKQKTNTLIFWLCPA